MPKVAEAEPTVELVGRINDAGYNGYIFKLTNRLHERIYHLDIFGGYWVQTRRGEGWLDDASHTFYPYRSRGDAAAGRKTERKHPGLITRDTTTFLDRLKSTMVFVPRTPEGTTWRVGFQYLPEKELNAGKKLQRSKRVVYSVPVSPGAVVKNVSFAETLGN